MYVKVFLLKKHVILFCSLLNMKKQLSFVVLFSFLSRISVGQYCLKNVGKKVERGEGWPYRGKELSIEGRGLKPSAHYGVQDSFRRSCSAHKYFKAFNKALIAFFKILQKQTFFRYIWTKKERFE